MARALQDNTRYAGAVPVAAKKGTRPMTVRIIESLDEGRVSFGDPVQEEQPIDPVCGASVSRLDAKTASAARGGSVYYFCSEDCKERFLEEPEAYV
jgi:YHS domain-containing protein